MAATVKTWTNNSPPQCEDDDLNGFKLENNNLIVGAGQILSDADREQTHKAVSHYAAGGDFYTDAGAANAYVLQTTVSHVAPPAYFAGMRVRFVAANANTGASTVNVASLGVKNLVLPGFPGANLNPGDVTGYVEAYYDGTDFILTSAPAVTAQNVQPTWIAPAQLGNSLSVAGTAAAGLTALNATDVAFLDLSNEELRTYRFDGTDWAQVGNSLSVSGVSGGVALATLSGTDIAFIDSGNEELRTYSFDGTDWAQVGSGLTISGVGGGASISALNGTDIAFTDNLLDELRTYRFDGANWAQVGSGLSTSISAGPSLSALNGTDVAFYEQAGDKELRTYRFDGANWAQVGSTLSLPGGLIPSGVLTTLNGTDVAFIDVQNDELTAFRFAFSVGPLPHNRQITG